MEDSFRGRVRAGDADAFGALFDDTARGIYRYAYRVTGDSAAAEDVVGLTFLQAWRLRRRVKPEGGSLTPWLYGIATNALRNSRRSAKRYQEAVQRIPVPEPVPDHADALVRREAEEERVAAARAALSRLSALDREVVVLCIWTGLTYAEAAEALDVPVGTIRSRLSRAKSRLQDLGYRELQALRATRMELEGVSGQEGNVCVCPARPAKENT